MTALRLSLWLPGLRLALRGSARRSLLLSGGCLSGGTGEVGGNHVGGVPVEAAAGTVVSHSGPGIGVRGGFLHVTERDPGVEGGGDERMPQRNGVRPAW